MSDDLKAGAIDFVEHRGTFATTSFYINFFNEEDVYEPIQKVGRGIGFDKSFACIEVTFQNCSLTGACLTDTSVICPKSLLFE